jgi:hypothetical protein
MPSKFGAFPNPIYRIALADGNDRPFLKKIGRPSGRDACETHLLHRIQRQGLQIP